MADDFTTNVPEPVFGERGFIAPEDAVILNGTSADINQAFGNRLNMSPSTPQGQLAASLAAIVSEVFQTFLYYTTQVDPAYARGRMQDAIARIYFIERIDGRASVVQAVCSGSPGTVITSGALATDLSGNIWVSQEDKTIPDSGSIEVQFACSVIGPIPCPVGALSTIYQSILGWDSITNPVEAELGRNVEGRREFEERRFASVAKNGIGFLAAMRGAVLEVDGVIDAYLTENVEETNIVVDGITILAKSIYVCVAGGAPDDVAKAIWSKKSPGCGMSGNTAVTVYDDINYSPPYPSYQIRYQSAEVLPFVIKVTIVNSNNVPNTAQADIRAAVVASFSGVDGGTRPRIGSVVYASQFYCDVAALGPWASIVSITMGTKNTAQSSFVGSISGMTLTVSGPSAGIAIGQTVQGDGVLNGTIIVGGAGDTWTVNLEQSVSLVDMVGILPESNMETVKIYQMPTIVADDIILELV